MKLKKGSAITVGNFDGVHVGHRNIFENLRAHARVNSLETVVMTFDPHPSVVLGFPPPLLLTTPQERVELIGALGIDHCVIQPFTKEVADMSAQAFIEKLKNDFNLQFLYMGPNTHVGKNRKGTPEKLTELSYQLGFSFVVAPPLEVDGEMVSSSKIRRLIQEGTVESAQKLLSRPHRTKGLIKEGFHRGKSFGFPTANLEWNPRLVIPKMGVYATYVSIEKRVFESVTNVGTRPTFGEGGGLSIESHLFDFEEDIRDQQLAIHWIRRLRGEVHFPSPTALANQIQEDVRAAQTIFERDGTHLSRELFL